MKKTLIILILALTFFKVYSQISIGNSSVPSSDVILDLSNSNNRALLLPSKTNTLPTGPQGMIIFDSDDDMIFYSKDGSNLNAISPWNYNPYSSTNVIYNLGGKVGISNSSPSAKLTISGGTAATLSNGSSGYMSVGSNNSNHLLFDSLGFMAKNQASTNPNEVTLELQKQGSGSININGNLLQKGFDYIPPGTIVMWRGSVVGDHPLVNGSQNTNWYICNGNNSTPDLRDRFIVGVGSDYGNAKGVTGGSNTNSHSHDVNFNDFTTSSDSHNHSSNANTSHVSGPDPAGCSVTKAWKSHSHRSSSNSHSHNRNLPNRTSGSGSYDNRPLYYSLYYMIKR